MAVADLPQAEWRRPSRWSTVVFAAKVQAHRLRRALADRLIGAPRRHGLGAALPVLVAESRTPLFSDRRPEERAYQDGKIENLKRAAAGLDGVVIPAGEVLSFWRQVGKPVASRGFVTGRMLQQGCLVPSVGGGLCQLSNALYQAARAAGCDIVERHAHSRAVPGSAAEAGRDATVAWNYVDLRIRAPQALRLEVRVEDNDLTVRLTGAVASEGPVETIEIAPPTPVVARTCATCDEIKCFRHQPRG